MEEGLLTTNGYLIYTNRKQYMIHDKHSYIRFTYSTVRAQLQDLSQKIQLTFQPTFVSHKIKQHLKPSEVKPSIVNQQSLVYLFKCNLCDAGYVGYTRWHLHQRVDEHKNASSSIGKHFRVKRSYVPNDLTKNFTILKQCKNKFDCLIYFIFIF